MALVFSVWFTDDRDMEEPTLFDRREDAEIYAGLWPSGRVDEVTVMDYAMAEGFIAEAEAELEADRA